MGLKEARDRREAARKLLADRVDPSANRKAQKQSPADQAANIFEIVAREWHTKHGASWVDYHGDRILKRLENDVFPWVGKQPISDITAPDLLKVAAYDDAAVGGLP